jgi:dienelactone hydrolase
MERRIWLMLVVSMALAAPAAAEVRTQAVDYKQGDTVLQGFIAWDDAKPGRRPGVLVVHEWWGHNEHARNQAKRLAQAGYVGFALDMFGKGKVTTHPKEAEAFMTEAMKDPAALAARFAAARAFLEKNEHVDASRIAAFGYCFGGGVVLEQARTGADLDAVVSFHGMLTAHSPAKKGAVRARIQVHTGGDDPFVPPAQVDAFKKELTDVGAKFEVIVYPGVKHAFTNPDAAKAGMPALVYDPDADKKSWEAAIKLLGQVFP